MREVADQTIGLRHFDEQLMGGWVLIEWHGSRDGNRGG